MHFGGKSFKLQRLETLTMEVGLSCQHFRFGTGSSFRLIAVFSRSHAMMLSL
jgi:hypothetical protein